MLASTSGRVIAPTLLSLCYIVAGFLGPVEQDKHDNVPVRKIMGVLPQDI